MRHATKMLWMVALTVGVGAVAAEDQTTQDKKAVETLVHGLFSKKVRDFEIPGKKNAKNVCEYLASIYESTLIAKENSFCVTAGAAAPRFPNMDSQDLSDLNEINTLPKHRITESGVKGAAAVVKVILPPVDGGAVSGRVVYFFKKTNDRWRISNILAYSEWPLDTNREGGCKDLSGYYHFALPPRSEADFEDLPPACRKLELDDRRRNGWGR